jgi:hypothetical protein
MIERGEIMIKLVKLPILTRILGILDGDSTDRDDMGKHPTPVDPGGGGGGGYSYCYCACYCSPAEYRDGFFNTWFYDVAG